MSNIYLDPLDHLVARSGFEMVRYADDFVILCRTAEEAQAALEAVRQWVAENGLTLHPTKTRIVDSRREGFVFLGYEFRGLSHEPSRKSRQALKDRIRIKTRRSSGDSMAHIVADLNPLLRGWFQYFKHSRPTRVFEEVDQWIRMRLRSIPRKRAGGRGRGRGADNLKWPNRFFAKLRLFSLEAAWDLAVQPSRR